MGSTLQKYILPGLETAGGAASEIFAPGNPIGLGLMGSGIGQLGGGALGGPRGQALGGGLGGLGGGVYGALGAPGMSTMGGLMGDAFGGMGGFGQAALSKLSDLLGFGQTGQAAVGAEGQPMDTGATPAQAPSQMSESDIGGTAPGGLPSGEGGELPPTSITGGESTGGQAKQGMDPMQQMLLLSLFGPMAPLLLGQTMGQSRAPGMTPAAAHGPGATAPPMAALATPTPSVPSAMPSTRSMFPSAPMDSNTPRGAMANNPAIPNPAQDMGSDPAMLGLLSYLKSQGML